MAETKIAKLFKNGSGQSVLLPSEFRFEGDEVYISRDEAGDVVLSSRPGAKTWDDFFELVRSIDVPDDFLVDRPMNAIPAANGVFDGEAQG